MSSAPHPHATHEEFDGEPTHVLPPDEPQTPGWIPVLGAVLFVGAGVWALLLGGGSSEVQPSPEGQAKSAAID